MTRFEIHHMKPKKFKVSKLVGMLVGVLICVGLLVGFNRYAQSTIKIEAPKFDPGQKVVVYLPNGKEVFTYENLIVEENGKLFYKGKWNTLDLTGGKIEYKDW